MPRQMCNECPFNPNSPYYHVRDRWAAACEEEMIRDGQPRDGSLAHGCHNLGDLSETTDETLICIGHQNWLRGVRHDK